MEENLNNLMDMTKVILEKLGGLNEVNETINSIKKDMETIKTDVSPLLDNKKITQQDEKKTLIVVDSMVRDFRSTSKTCQIKTLRGKGFLDIHEFLQSRESLYKDLFIIAGTNDCTTPTPILLEDTTTHFKQMLETATSKAEKVTISSILPRADYGSDSEVLKKLQDLNEMMREECQNQNANFIENDQNFKYINGEPDKDLLMSDGLHLTDKGTMRLIANLGVGSVAKCCIRQVDSNLREKSDTKSTASNQTVYFHGHKDELSNFYPCELYINGKYFSSSEAAYQHRKAIEHDDECTADLIQSAVNAAEAKRLSHNIEVDPSWYHMKSDIMMEILQTKADQCPEFRNRLVSTGTAELVEDTSDEYWARGLRNDGENMMGTLLMLLRQKLNQKKRRQGKSRQQRTRPRQDTRGRYDHHTRCSHCGEINHTTDRCRFDRPLRCHQCQDVGHKKKFCHQSHDY